MRLASFHPPWAEVHLVRDRIVKCSTRAAEFCELLLVAVAAAMAWSIAFCEDQKVEGGNGTRICRSCWQRLADHRWWKRTRVGGRRPGLKSGQRRPERFTDQASGCITGHCFCGFNQPRGGRTAIILTPLAIDPSQIDGIDHLAQLRRSTYATSPGGP